MQMLRLLLLVVGVAHAVTVIPAHGSLGLFKKVYTWPANCDNLVLGPDTPLAERVRIDACIIQSNEHQMHILAGELARNAEHNFLSTDDIEYTCESYNRYYTSGGRLINSLAGKFPLPPEQDVPSIEDMQRSIENMALLNQLAPFVMQLEIPNVTEWCGENADVSLIA